MKPAAREVAIQTGMELHDALAETRKEELRSTFEKEWASKYDELYKQVSEEQAKRFAEKMAEADRKAGEYQGELISLRRAYLTMYLGWFAEGAAAR